MSIHCTYVFRRLRIAAWTNVFLKRKDIRILHKDINQEPGGMHMVWLWPSDRSFTGIFREPEMCPFFPPP